MGGAVWRDAAWRARIEAWAAGQLESVGRRIVGPTDQPHVRPWSTALRIPTDGGVVWCKAAGVGSVFEARLLAAFAAWRTPGTLEPIAIDPDRGWILLPDGGPTLREARPDGTGDHDLGAWERLLVEYAALQRSTGPRATELLALGVPDGRPAILVPTLRTLLDDEALWDPALQGPADRAAVVEARPRLRALGAWVAERAAVLDGSGIGPTIQHDDLHGGNIFVGPAGVRFFDWGDAVVAHPFGTLTVTINSIAHRLGREADDPALERVRDAYLEPWTNIHPRSELEPIVEAALDLGRIARAAAWARSRLGLRPEAMDGQGGAPAAWLADLVDRIDRREASR